MHTFMVILMDTIMDIAKRHNLIVVEDAAQGVMSKYKGKHLGTIGTFGCYSFHETKNYYEFAGGNGSVRQRICPFAERRGRRSAVWGNGRGENRICKRSGVKFRRKGRNHESYLRLYERLRR